MLISSTARLKSAPRISTQNNGQRRCDWIMEGSYKVGNRDEFFPINAAVVGQYAEYWLNRLSAGVVIYFWGDLRTEKAGESERYIIIVYDLKVMCRPQAPAQQTPAAPAAPSAPAQSAPTQSSPETAAPMPPAIAAVAERARGYAEEGARREAERKQRPVAPAPSDGLNGPESWDGSGDLDF